MVGRYHYLYLVVIFYLSQYGFCQQNNTYEIGEGQCIMYEMCAPNPEKPNQNLNCQYDGPALELEGVTSVRLLKSTCPELYDEILATPEYDGKLVTCCSAAQLLITAEELTSLTLILKNCPACLSNLRRNFCYFACHPRQSAFITPDSIYKNESYGDSVLSVTQYSSNAYVTSTYDSCENVYFPSINGPAFSILCGPWGADHCSAQRLFDYFGNNYLAPFNISYVYTDETSVEVPNLDDDSATHTMVPFNVETYPCNSTDPDLYCRCLDCQQSCADPPQAEAEKEFVEVGHVRLYVFILIVLYCVFAVGFVLFAVAVGLPGNEEEKFKICTWNFKISAAVEENLQKTFRNFTSGVVRHPFLVLLAGGIIIVALASGITKLKMTTDPVDLWATPDSRSRKDKEHYDRNFGPFYRTNQIIITSVGVQPFNQTLVYTSGSATYEFGPVFNYTFLTEVLDMQLDIMALEAEYNGELVTLNDICIKPLDPLYDDCLIESVLNYWQNDPQELEDQMYDDQGQETYDYTKHLLTCVSNPTYISSTEDCLGTYGGPIYPYVALGGYMGEGENLVDTPEYEKSTALVLTILGQNYNDDEKIGPALAWEKKYLEYMSNYSNPMMDIAYYAERSIEDEIVREGKSDVATILVSYLVMFAYVAVSLGNFNVKCGRMFIETKITLGLCSVVLVFMAVVSSVGFCAYLGVESTLFVIEVIPFLVLAVGVDNIFLLVQSMQRDQRREGETIEDHVARIVGKIAPSMLLATLSEATCFFLGALSQMPAVYSFSIYAGVALTIDFLLQITCLVALIVLDYKRTEDNRLDILCCAQGPKKEIGAGSPPDICLSFFEDVYSPLLMQDRCRIVVVLLFSGCFLTSCAFVPQMDVGLEQDIGMPDDSYVIKYFNFLADYVSVGAPVYFVIKEGFAFQVIEEQNLICESTGCNNDSLLAQIFWASESPDVTYIATGATTWLDDYFSWLSDTGGSNEEIACCRLDENGDFVDTSEETYENTSSTCLKERDFEDNDRPKPEFFMEYLPDFLIDNPHGVYCPQAGHPSYGSAVVIKEEDCYNQSSCVGANYFMAYHNILKVSKDFSGAVEKAYELTDYMTEYIRNNSLTPDVEVYPYSVFYVYYEQYLTMWSTVGTSLGISFATVFLVMLVLTGFDLRSCGINFLVIIMITIDIMALMVPCNIQLNAISLVNLVMAVGISVEFCSHISHAFAISSDGTKVSRAAKALTNTGSSVLSGITLTKFGGIIVLGFAHSQVIQVFYFRMYMMIVLLGATHGLIFLPVLLSLIGPSPNPYIYHEVDEASEPTPKAFNNKGFDVEQMSMS